MGRAMDLYGSHAAVERENYWQSVNCHLLAFPPIFQEEIAFISL
jgi:hypothetical protein